MSTGNGETAATHASRAARQGKHAAQNAAKAAEAAVEEGVQAVDHAAEKVAKTPVALGDVVGVGSFVYGTIYLVLKIKSLRQVG